MSIKPIAGTEYPDKEREKKRHLLISYLRFYYPDVCRVLEREPVSSFQDLLAVCKGESGTSNFYSFFMAKVKNDLPDNPFINRKGTETAQKSDFKPDMENMEQHLDIFDCRERFKKMFAKEFTGYTDLSPYL